MLRCFASERCRLRAAAGLLRSLVVRHQTLVVTVCVPLLGYLLGVFSVSFGWLLLLACAWVAWHIRQLDDAPKRAEQMVGQQT